MASTNFLVFDEGKQNMMSDGDYSANTQRARGVTPGIAYPNLHNKLYYQVSVMAKAIADFMVVQGANASDEDVEQLTADISTAFTNFVDNKTKDVYLPLSGGTMKGNINANGYNITATKFIGNLQGKADSAANAEVATKATQDSKGRQIDTTYLKLSGGTLTGDITANNVYANNNVLVFNNVADMKASNKVKTGYTLKTLGFYTAGDGGGADYVITNDIGEDEVDEASLIKLKNGLYAKLMIKDFINIKWFGAYVDGEHDDSTAFNNCVAYLQRTKKEIEQIQALAVKTKVVIPHGVMKISDTIKIDINVMSLDGGGSVILADGLEDNSYAVWVNNWSGTDGYAQYTDIISQVGNFILTGTSRFDPINGLLMGTKEYPGNSEVGWGAPRVRMERIMVQNVYTGITWGNNQYLDSWYNISVNHCHVGLDNLSSPQNTGENINFHSSVFVANDKMYNTSLTMLFNNCSFDYNTQWFNPPTLRAWLTDCYIEGWFFNGEEYSKNPFVTTSSGNWCRFKMVGGTVNAVNTVHSGDVALFDVGTTAHQGIVISDVFLEKLASTYLINGTGVYRVNLNDYNDTAPDKIASVCNVLGLNTFEGLTALPKEISCGSSETLQITGNVLKVTTQSPPYGWTRVYATVKWGNHRHLKLFFKARMVTTSTITTQSVQMSVYEGYYDKNGEWVQLKNRGLNIKPTDAYVANQWLTGTLSIYNNQIPKVNAPYVRLEIKFQDMYTLASPYAEISELQVSGY